MTFKFVYTYPNNSSEYSTILLEESFKSALRKFVETYPTADIKYVEVLN